MPKMKAYENFDAYLADQAPRNQAIIRALRKFVDRSSIDERVCAALLKQAARLP